MEIKLIHIGFPKAASTVLQSLWNITPGICLVQHGLISLIDVADKYANGLVSGDGRFLIDFDHGPPVEGDKIILSSEALCGPLLGKEKFGDLAKFRDTIASSLARVAGETKIMVVLRQPELWLLSVYNQFVKMGIPSTFPEFQQIMGSYLADFFDVVNLVDVWAKYFGRDNILVLPSKMLRDDSGAFFAEVERFSGVPVPQDQVEDLPVVVQNKSLKPPALAFMREVNEWVHFFVQNGVLPQGQPDPSESIHVVRNFMRYSLQLFPERLERRICSVAEKFSSCNAENRFVDRDLLAGIKNGLQTFFGDSDFYGYRERYLASMEEL